MAKEVPKEYARHADVFDEEKAKCFPPKREEDHTIKLRDDALVVLDCKIYQLSPDQDQKLNEFLNEHLKRDIYGNPTPPMLRLSFSSKRRMGSSDQSRTTGN